MHTGARRRAVERVLEGWNIAKAEPCKLEELASLKSAWRRNGVVEQVGLYYPSAEVDYNSERFLNFFATRSCQTRRRI